VSAKNAVSATTNEVFCIMMVSNKYIKRC